MVCDRLEVAHRHRVTLGHRGQVDFAIGQLGVRVVLSFDVGPQEAGELDDRPDTPNSA